MPTMPFWHRNDILRRVERNAISSILFYLFWGWMCIRVYTMQFSVTFSFVALVKFGPVHWVEWIPQMISVYANFIPFRLCNSFYWIQTHFKPTTKVFSFFYRFSTHSRSSNICDMCTLCSYILHFRDQMCKAWSRKEWNSKRFILQACMCVCVQTQWNYLKCSNSICRILFEFYSCDGFFSSPFFEKKHTRNGSYFLEFHLYKIDIWYFSKNIHYTHSQQ